MHLAVDHGIDLDSKAPNWSYGRKSQSPFFLEAGRFGAAYGTEITKINNDAASDECRNVTGFGPSADLKLSGNAFPQDGDTFTVYAHTGSGHYAIVNATLHGGAQNFTAADLNITVR